MNRFLKPIIGCLALCTGVGATPEVLAYTGWCAAGSDTSTPGQGSPHQYVFSLNKTIDDITMVDPGQQIQQNWSENGKYTAWCDNEPGIKGVTFFKGRAGPQLINNKVPGNDRYYYIPNTSDFLSVETHIDLVYHAGQRVPFDDISNQSPDDHSTPKASWSSGGSGYILLRIEKQITSSRIIIPSTIVAEMWGSHVKGSYGPSPMVLIVVSGSIIVPQSCTINAGTVVLIDLGPSWAGDFNTPGVKPDAYEAKTVTIKAHCSNTAAAEQLNLGLEAPNAGNYGAIKTNKENLGIMLSAKSMQSAETVFRSDDPSIRVPFQLDTDDGEATITLKAWPVKMTSDDPTPGNYAGIALLDIYTP